MSLDSKLIWTIFLTVVILLFCYCMFRCALTTTDPHELDRSSNPFYGPTQDASASSPTYSEMDRAVGSQPDGESQVVGTP